MARDNVISIDQSHGGARRRVSDARVYELVAACRTRIADTLPRLLQELFEHLDDELYQLADKSANDMLQTRYFEAMRELRLPLATTSAVLAELFHLLGSNPRDVAV